MIERPHFGMLITHVYARAEPDEEDPDFQIEGVVMLLGPAKEPSDYWDGIVLQGPYWWGRGETEERDLVIDLQNPNWIPWEPRKE